PRAADPALADAAARHRRAGFRIDHPDLRGQAAAARADALARVGVAGLGVADLVTLQRRLADRAHQRTASARAAGHEQRGLGHAVAGELGLSAHAALTEGVHEVAQRGRAHRLGAVVGDLQAGQVEPGLLFVADLVGAI